MFNFSFSEILLTALVALIVFGPKRLPEVAEKLGSVMAKMRRGIANLSKDSTEHK